LSAADEIVEFAGAAAEVPSEVAPACSDPQPAIHGKHAAQVAINKEANTA
jgi:hypothetical protein